MGRKGTHRSERQVYAQLTFQKPEHLEAYPKCPGLPRITVISYSPTVMALCMLQTVVGRLQITLSTLLSLWGWQGLMSELRFQMGKLWVGDKWFPKMPQLPVRTEAGLI